jgi:hypothetical protein
LISRNMRFSKFREHVRRWAFERTNIETFSTISQRLTHFCPAWPIAVCGGR